MNRPTTTTAHQSTTPVVPTQRGAPTSQPTQVASAIQLIVQATRLPGGKRKVTRVSEISGMEGEQITMHDVFSFEQQGVDGNGHATGQFICSGIRPRCCERIEQRGINLPMDLFARRAMDAM